jgi:hypothetical protein
VAKDVLVVICGAVLSGAAGLLVGRLWVLRRGRERAAAAERPQPDLSETLEREAAATARAAEDVEAHSRQTALEREA